MDFNNMTLEEINELGKKYYNEEKYEEAFQCFLYAAKKGFFKAQNNLGVCYEYGRGIEQNYEEAIKWYLLSSEQGNAGAQNNLGNCY